MVGSRTGRAVLWVLVLGVAGCGLRQSKESEEVRPVTNVPVTVVVQNHNWADIVVYAVHSGGRLRLGAVTSMGSETFRLPSTLNLGSSALRLQADPIGSRWTYTSEGVVVSPGQWVEWRIENNLRLSSIAVW